ncbi:ATP-binding cassette domain-containing protein [Egicoccus sp. AB-alg6-2]|uniref:ATP-binding cassette domain-containing protein n=1 Tax=Egicoccus sp. AB-alg6-2 TaxID=3242692 RepID=UPI00359E64EB
MQEPRLAIEAAGLVKTYGEVRALDGLDLRVPVGGVYAVLGPNGAGKTTAIRLLATLIPADGGRASVLGHDVATAADDVRSRVSLTGQFASLDEDLTGLENLVLIARLLGFDRAAAARRGQELLGAFGLADAAARQVKHYSGGMRRRLDIAASIVVRPELLFLDEPTTGLDPSSRGQVWDIVRALVAAGTTVLLTTQYLDEADKLADRIAVVDLGRVIAEGTAGELKASVGRGTLHVRVRHPDQRPAALALLRESLGVDVHADGDAVALSAQVDDPGAVARALVRLTDAGIVPGEFALGQPSLDEVFLALTGRRPTASETPPNEEDAA